LRRSFGRLVSKIHLLLEQQLMAQAVMSTTPRRLEWVWNRINGRAFSEVVQTEWLEDSLPDLVPRQPA
jgi:hypothetical protein